MRAGERLTRNIEQLTLPVYHYIRNKQLVRHNVVVTVVQPHVDNYSRRSRIARKYCTIRILFSRITLHTLLYNNTSDIAYVFVLLYMPLPPTVFKFSSIATNTLIVKYTYKLKYFIHHLYVHNNLYRISLQARYYL